jgi:hypothetical protein
MNASTPFWRLLGTVTLGLVLATPSAADDKEKKEGGKAKEAKPVIVIQLDASKLPPEVLKKLMELSKNTATDKGEKGRKHEEDDKKGEKGRKHEEDDQKGEKTGKHKESDKQGEKSRKHEEKGEKTGKHKESDKGKKEIIQVDLSKLSPELARRLKDELAKKKGAK